MQQQIPPEFSTKDIIHAMEVQLDTTDTGVHIDDIKQALPKHDNDTIQNELNALGAAGKIYQPAPEYYRTA